MDNQKFDFISRIPNATHQLQDNVAGDELKLLFKNNVKIDLLLCLNQSFYASNRQNKMDHSEWTIQIFQMRSATKSKSCFCTG